MWCRGIQEVICMVSLQKLWICLIIVRISSLIILIYIISLSSSSRSCFASCDLLQFITFPEFLKMLVSFLDFVCDLLASVALNVLEMSRIMHLNSLWFKSFLYLMLLRFIWNSSTFNHFNLHFPSFYILLKLFFFQFLFLWIRFSYSIPLIVWEYI